MNEYEKQGIDFLTKTNTTMTRKYLKFDTYFPNDKEKRDIWEITLTRGERSYTFTFGASLKDSGKVPTAYNVLSCIEKYEPENDIDSFASEFGYTKPSEALRVFNAVHEQWNNIKMLFSDEEIEALREIQ